jgi:hypothetical protein
MQETNLYTITILPMKKALLALSGLLDKTTAHAETKKLAWMPASQHEAALLNDRLIFDQFPLVRQIQIACDNAKGCAARLSGRENPKYEDTEKTIAELKARIEKTIAFLDSMKPEEMIGKEGVQITLPYFPGKYMTGFEYVTEYVFANFYFHVTTAYAILRKNGLDIGKNDYIGGLPLKDTDA